VNPVQKTLNDLHDYVERSMGAVNPAQREICHTEIIKLDALLTYCGIKDANPAVERDRDQPKSYLQAIFLDAQNAEIIYQVAKNVTMKMLEEIYINNSDGYIVLAQPPGALDAIEFWTTDSFYNKYEFLKPDDRNGFTPVRPKNLIHDPKKCGGPGICLPCSTGHERLRDGQLI
jgi:hypothetical protein